MRQEKPKDTQFRVTTYQLSLQISEAREAVKKAATQAIFDMEKDHLRSLLKEMQGRANAR